MEINFDKMNGLVPAIIQDATTRKVLMLGFMNKEAYEKTVETGKVTFYSRTKERLWTKGEQSGNFLNVVSIQNDCDQDTLLIQVHPTGPVCHTGTDTCWGEKNEANPLLFLSELQDFIEKRYQESLLNLKRVLPLCDLAVLYDNTEKFRRFAIYRKGAAARISNNVPKWYFNIENREK